MTITLDKPTTTKMNPEVKAAWLEHLRSGKYKQGTGNLNVDGKMCCLGVLSDMAADEGICSRTPPESVQAGVVRYDNDVYYLPYSVQKWAGVGQHNLWFEITTEADKATFADFVGSDDPNRVYLAMLNDGGYTFEQIADIIEERF